MLIDRVYLKECFSKQRHYTEKAALAHMDSLKLLPDAIDPERLHVYECRFAIPNERHWHVGHIVKEEVWKDQITARSAEPISSPASAAIVTER